MEHLETFIRKLLETTRLSDYSLDLDLEHRHGSLFIHDEPTFIKNNLPSLVEALNHVIQLVARKHAVQPVFLDVNNYRKEREQLIVQLAKATAKKVVATKEEVPLPIMNSYERRLAHMELAMHPDVTTESVGKGKGRYVVVRPIQGTEAGQPTSTPSVSESVL